MFLPDVNHRLENAKSSQEEEGVDLSHSLEDLCVDDSDRSKNSYGYGTSNLTLIPKSSRGKKSYSIIHRCLWNKLQSSMLRVLNELVKRSAHLRIAHARRRRRKRTVCDNSW